MDDIYVTLFYTCIFQLFSIGFSDAYEFFTNPLVHEIHNCPDIMRIPWEKYNCLYAFMSGIKCSWFLVLFEYILFCSLKYSFGLKFRDDYIRIALAINVNLPGIYLFSGNIDTFFGHQLLYLTNFISFILTLIF